MATEKQRDPAPASVKARSITLFQGGLSADAVGAQIGFSGAAVRKWLRAAGINPTRKQKPEVSCTDMGGTPKRCVLCGEIFPATPEHFYVRERRGRTELLQRCKGCVRAKTTARRLLRDPVVIAQEQKEYRAKNLAELKAKAKARKAARSPERRAEDREKMRRWQAENKERLVVYHITRRHQNIDKMRAADKERYHKNKDKFRAYGRAYKARRKGAEGWFTMADIAKKMSDQGGACFWCKGNLSDGYHADHYIPLKRGGTNWPDNIVLSCSTCNLSRRHKMPDEFREYLKMASPAWMRFRYRRPPTQDEVATVRARYAGYQRAYRARKRRAKAASQ